MDSEPRGMRLIFFPKKQLKMLTKIINCKIIITNELHFIFIFLDILLQQKHIIIYNGSCLGFVGFHPCLMNEIFLPGFQNC